MIEAPVIDIGWLYVFKNFRRITMRKTYAFICAAFCLFLAVPQGKASSLCDSTPGQLVANCGFETGDFTSWTLSGNNVPGEEGNLYGVEGADPDGTSPNSGNFQAFFGTFFANPTTLEQTITTQAGGKYSVSWFLAQDTDATEQNPNEFSASFGGVSLVSTIGVPVQGYTEYSFLVDATSSSSSLDLTFGNDLGFFLVDDVSVTAVTPEPPAWTLMLVGLMGAAFFWKRDELVRLCNVRI
jgi:hypothetical protein